MLIGKGKGKKKRLQFGVSEVRVYRKLLESSIYATCRHNARGFLLLFES